MEKVFISVSGKTVAINLNDDIFAIEQFDGRSAPVYLVRAVGDWDYSTSPEAATKWNLREAIEMHRLQVGEHPGRTFQIMAVLGGNAYPVPDWPMVPRFPVTSNTEPKQPEDVAVNLPRGGFF